MNEKIEGDPRSYMKPYLGHWDVPEDGDLILTIDELRQEDVKNQHGTETKPVLHFMEPNTKPMILNITNVKAIAKALGNGRAKYWHGKKIALYEAKEDRSDDGLALRVRQFAPKQDELICEECGAVIEDITIDGKKYKGRVVAENAKTKFGRYLCYDCAQKAKAEAGE